VLELKKSKLCQEALGEHIFTNFVEAKETIWHEYIAQVHTWEHERYLMRY
jgi:glutamine synthetase